MGYFFSTSRYSFIEWRRPSGAVARQRLARGVNDLKSSSFRWFRPRLKKVEETENKDDDDNGDNIHNNDNNGGDDDSNDDDNIHNNDNNGGDDGSNDDGDNNSTLEKAILVTSIPKRFFFCKTCRKVWDKLTYGCKFQIVLTI